MIIDKYFQGKLLSSKIYPTFLKLNKSDIVINLGCGKSQQALIYKGQYQKMYGIDINEQAIRFSKKVIRDYNLDNYSVTKGNIEKTEFPSNFFDKAIVIDVIECTENPIKFCKEVHKILKHNGKLLITFAALHDRYMAVFNFLKTGKLRTMFSSLFRIKKGKVNEWNPSAHNHVYRISNWLKIVESCGFKLNKSRGTTIFPPLHFFGIKKFWFSNKIINSIDSYLCKLPILKRLGQAYLCVFEKI